MNRYSTTTQYNTEQIGGTNTMVEALTVISAMLLAISSYNLGVRHGREAIMKDITSYMIEHELKNVHKPGTEKD